MAWLLFLVVTVMFDEASGTCSSPPPVDNAKHDGDDDTIFPPFLMIRYTCHHGYVESGGRTIMCLRSGLWTETDFKCFPACPSPEDTDNGWHNGIGTDYFAPGHNLTYSCRAGFVSHGKRNITCREDTTWTELEMRCLRDCSSPPALQNAVHDANGVVAFTPSHVITYTCQMGYKPTGQPTITCLNNGLWSKTQLICSRKCPFPSVTSNAVHNADTSQEYFLPNEVVKYTCSVGFVASGLSTIRCQHNGTWTSLKLKCIPMTCADPGIPEHGRRQGQLFAFGQQVNFTCRTGYRLQGRATLYCQADGFWNHATPNCLPVECPTLQTPSNGWMFPKDLFIYGTKVDFFCDDGHVWTGTPSRTCQNNGQWTGSDGQCRGVLCPSLPVLSNGQYLPSNQRSFNTTVTTSCLRGYTWTGASSRTCLANRLWSGVNGECARILCGDPGVPKQGKAQGRNFLFGGQVTFTCDAGYELQGPERIFCQENSTWTRLLPTCTRISCPKLAAPQHGQIFPTGEYLFETSVTFFCDKGFQWTGSVTTTCASNGKWTGTMGACEAIKCPALPSISNGEYMPSNQRTLNTVVEVQCLPGYSWTGTASRTCQASKQWSGVNGECARILCGDPGKPRQGKAQGRNFLFGGQLVFSCDPGYKLQGPERIFCQANSTWTKPLPMCISISCSELESPEHGQLFPTGKSLFGSTVQFFCDKGYHWTGSASRTCEATGKWSGTVGVCEAVCSHPPEQAYAQHDGGEATDGFQVGHVITYTCLPEYLTRGLSTIQCLASGSWSPLGIICSRKCRRPPQLVFGRHDAGGSVQRFAPGEVVTFSCLPGYEGAGKAQITCQESGTWSGLELRCYSVAQICPQPAPLNYATPDVTSQNRFYPGHMVSYTCGADYVSNGANNTITCSNAGKWTDLGLLCTSTAAGAHCGTPPNIADGYHVGDASQSNPGSILRYVCNTGYKGRGSGMVVCLASGYWTELGFICEDILPPTLPTQTAIGQPTGGKNRNCPTTLALSLCMMWTWLIQTR